MNPGTRRWARLVIVANFVFVGAWLLAATWQGTGYSVAEHTISDMYADGAPGAWFLVLTFTLCGAAVLLFAFRSLWPALRAAGWPARVGVLLLGLSIFGLGDLLSVFEQQGCRLADAGCTPDAQTATFGGAADATLSTFGAFALPVCGLVLAAAMKRLPEWQRWSRPTCYGAIAILALLLLDGILGGAGLGGLGERLFALGGAAGITMLAVGVLRRAVIVARASA
ncbi:MAG TPA: DUF998 domain-containing protein [Actinophytocola sp.]|jgi:hypothetical protein|nr:DUF998 domain-containing protein [Actinophytocola sp.]